MQNVPILKRCACSVTSSSPPCCLAMRHGQGTKDQGEALACGRAGREGWQRRKRQHKTQGGDKSRGETQRGRRGEAEGLANLHGVISHPAVSFYQPPGHKRRGEKESRRNNFGTEKRFVKQ